LLFHGGDGDERMIATAADDLSGRKEQGTADPSPLSNLWYFLLFCLG
jgi:hypothetical protein